MSDEKPKLGRPSKFNDRVCQKIIELASDGRTIEEIAEIIGVSPQTIYVWQKTKDEFRESLKEAKLDADALVEASLFRRACGYSHNALKFFSYEGTSWSEEYIEHYPPDTVAAIFWLKNRQPDRWRDKQPGEESPAAVVNNVQLTDEQLANLIRVARGDGK